MQKKTDNGPRELMEKTCPSTYHVQDYNCSTNVSPQLTNFNFKIVKHWNYTPFWRLQRKPMIQFHRNHFAFLSTEKLFFKSTSIYNIIHRSDSKYKDN